MPRLVWVSTSNPAKQYITSINNDPNVPAGYILSNTSDGSCQCVDGKTDQNLQQFVGGINSGGYPAYNGDPSTIGKQNPNGILNG
jgi:hypothetical protein